MGASLPKLAGGLTGSIVSQQVQAALAGALPRMAGGLVATGPASPSTDVTTFVAGGSGTQWVTFGQAFAVGDVPSGQTIVVTDTANSALATSQCDVKATHPDGSVRHAIITARVTGGSSYKLRKQTATLPGQVSGWKAALAAALNTTSVAFTGGVVATVNIGALVAAQADDLWLSGPACVETRVFSDVSSHIRLYADCRYHSDGVVRVDIGIENPWVYGGLRGDRTYTFQITAFGNVGGAESITHRANTRIRKTFWSSTPGVWPQHNLTYLKSTNAVPNYSNPTAIAAITNTTLANLPQAVATQSSSGYGSNMPSGGLDNGIGPCPHHQAIFLMANTDVRAWTSVRDQVAGGGAFSIHARDAGTGRPVRIDQRSSAGWNSNGDFDSGGSAPANASYTADVAHMPSIGYVPYLVTGDRWALDELHFWANWVLLTYEYSIGTRGGSAGRVGGQTRGVAWGLREIGRAAFITPDADPLRAYFTTILNANATALTSAYGTSGSNRNNFGAYDQDTVDGPGTEQSRLNSKTWMDDFLTWSIGELVALGFSNWQSFFDYKAGFPIGRIGGTEFPFMAMGQDTIRLQSAAGQPFFTTWSQVAAASGVGMAVLAAPNAGNPTVAQATYLNNSGGEGAVFSLGIPRGYPPLPGSRFGTAFIAAAPVVDRKTSGWQRMWGRLLAATRVPNGTFGPPRPNWVDDGNGGAANALWPRSFTDVAVPAYIRNIPAGAAVQLATKIPDAWVNFTGRAGSIEAAIQAWTGAVWDSKRNRLVWTGGGHVDYNGTDVYAFAPYSSESPTWQRIIAHDLTKGFVSNHTYGLGIYDPIADRFVLLGSGSTYPGGGEAGTVYAADLANNVWLDASLYQAIPANPEVQVQGASAQYDPDLAVGWLRRIGGGAKLMKYDLATRTIVGAYSDGFNLSIDFTTALHPWHRYMIAIGGYGNNGPTGGGGNELIIWDLNTASGSSVTAYRRTVTGLPSGDKWGLEFHPPTNTFVAWNGGATAYRLFPPADPFSTNWTASPVTITGTPPPSYIAKTYSKFRWAPYPNDPTRGVFLCWGASGGYPVQVSNMHVWKPNF